MRARPALRRNFAARPSGDLICDEHQQARTRASLIAGVAATVRTRRGSMVRKSYRRLKRCCTSARYRYAHLANLIAWCAGHCRLQVGKDAVDRPVLFHLDAAPPATGDHPVTLGSLGEACQVLTASRRAISLVLAPARASSSSSRSVYPGHHQCSCEVVQQ